MLTVADRILAMKARVSQPSSVKSVPTLDTAPDPTDVFSGILASAANNAVKDQMASMFGNAAKNRGKITVKDIVPSVGVTTTATQFHGSSSLFGDDCALDRSIVSGIVVPEGILGILPAIGTNTLNKTVGLLTGFNQDDKPKPDYKCEDGPSGTYEACKIGFVWGRSTFSTNDIDWQDIIMRLNSGDTDLMLMGQMLSRTNGRLSTQQVNTSQMLNVVMISEMVGVGILFERELSQLIWQGDPLNNTAHGGYAEPYGLDSQITTGIVDYDSGLPCPDIDSTVFDWNYALVCDEHATTGDVIAYTLSEIFYFMQDLVRKTGIGPAQWVMVMHPSLFRELTECFPCQYLTDRCNPVGDAASVVINTPDNIDLRDALRQGMYLPLNGINVPVRVDDGVYEQNNTTTPLSLNAGQYASDIYFLPMTIRGGFPVTYIEYKDFRSPIALRELSYLGGRNNFWSDDGVFTWAMQQVNWCFKMTAALEWRVILRTPHIAAKITNVKYAPLFKVRNPYA